MPKRPKQPKRTLGNSIRLGLFWAIVILASLAAWAYMTPAEKLKEVPIAQVITEANAGKLAKIEGQGDNLTLT